MVMRWSCRVQLPVMDASKQWQLPMAIIAPEYEHLNDPRPRSMRASGTIVMPEPAEVPQPQVQQAPEVASAGPDAAEAFPGGSMQEKAERLLLDALPCLALGAKEDLPGESMDEKVLNLAHAHREKAERESAKAAAEEEAEYEAARAMQLKRQDDRHRLEARRRSSEEDVRDPTKMLNKALLAVVLPMIVALPTTSVDSVLAMKKERSGPPARKAEGLPAAAANAGTGGDKGFPFCYYLKCTLTTGIRASGQSCVPDLSGDFCTSPHSVSDGYCYYFKCSK
eukprot:jgi/Chrpa1/16173/Chrysochromulina_OHIO_Genome00020486-RA